MQMSDVPVSHEGRRGCGYRKGGGMYLMAAGPDASCGRMPIMVDRCPTCHGGIGPARGWTWIDAHALVEGKPCSPAPGGDDFAHGCGCGLGCPLCQDLHGSPDRPLQEAGLIWIGAQHYPTPEAFLEEARRMGVSRRISAVPQKFEVGKTWVLFGHRDARTEPCAECAGAGKVAPDDTSAKLVPCTGCKGKGRKGLSGIIGIFKPDRVEYVVKGDETEEELDALVKRGLTPIRVVEVPDDDPQADLPTGDGPAAEPAPGSQAAPVVDGEPDAGALAYSAGQKVLYRLPTGQLEGATVAAAYPGQRRLLLELPDGSTVRVGGDALDRVSPRDQLPAGGPGDVPRELVGPQLGENEPQRPPEPAAPHQTADVLVEDGDTPLDLSGCAVRVLLDQAGVGRDVPFTVEDAAGGRIRFNLGDLEPGNLELQVDGQVALRMRVSGEAPQLRLAVAPAEPVAGWAGLRYQVAGNAPPYQVVDLGGDGDPVIVDRYPDLGSATAAARTLNELEQQPDPPGPTAGGHEPVGEDLVDGPDQAFREAMAEADMAQYDDDPSPYAGTYSED